MRATLILFALLAIAPAAHAEYACAVGYLSPIYLGTGGAISVTSTPSPNCVGASTVRVICSAGATHFQCGKTVNFTAAAIQGHFQALVAAAASDQPIWFALGACAVGDANNCVLGVTFVNGS